MAFTDFVEHGQYTVNSDWTSITLLKPDTRDIAIFAKANSFNNGDPSSNRARNTLAPVEIRLQNISKGSGATPASLVRWAHLRGGRLLPHLRRLFPDAGATRQRTTPHKLSTELEGHSQNEG